MLDHAKTCAGCALLVLLLIVVPAETAVAQADATAQADWEFVLTPFLWGSGLDGTITVAGQQQDVEASVQQLLEALDFGFMVNLEARNEKWVFAFDFVYTDLGKEATVGSQLGLALPATADISMTIVEGDFGYRVSDKVDVFGGIRGVNTPVSLSIEGEQPVDADGGFVDPIVGLRFRTDLTEKIWFNFRGDIGGFGVGSDFSWFLGAGIAYRITRLVSLGGGYRVWGFDYESDGELKKFDATLAGFAFAAAFHF